MSDKEEKDTLFKVADKRRFDAEGSVREEVEGSVREEVDSQAEISDRSNESVRDSAANEAGSPEISFSSFVVSLATQALMQLGEIPSPPGVQMEQNNALAKQTIELLIMLKEKTKGNLDKAEKDLMEEILHSVQMSFVRRARQNK